MPATARKAIWAALGSAALCACVGPQVAVNPRADFSQINRVAVVTFSGAAGDVAADMLTQQLVAHGANVVERQQLNAILQEQHLATSGALDPRTIKQVGKILGVDALFIGTVSQSMPAQSYLVTGAGRRNVVTTVTPVGNAAVVSEGPVFGVPNSQVVTTEATASVVARMVDVQTASILWSGSMTYEGFDVQSAMESISEAFVHSLDPIWPALIAPKR